MKYLTLFVLALILGCAQDTKPIEIIVEGKDSLKTMIIKEKFEGLSGEEIKNMVFGMARSTRDSVKFGHLQMAYVDVSGERYGDRYARELISALNGDYMLDGDSLKIEEGIAYLAKDTIPVGLLGNDMLVFSGEENIVFKMGENGEMHGAKDGKLLTLKKLEK